MRFDEYVNHLKRKINVSRDETLFVCIGTSRILWDSIGPRVGSYLKERIDDRKVLGDINNNICSKWDLIYYYPKIKNKFIVAIDSAISSKELEGEVFVSNRPIIMGLGLNKNKGTIGNISIKVSVSDIENTNREYINYMAEFIGKGICEVNKIKK